MMEQVEGFMLKQPEVQSMVGVLGFSFSGQGQNAALAFVTLKDWSERTGPPAAPGRGWPRVWCAGGRARCVHLSAQPAPIPELGSASGFSFRLQDRGGLGFEALMAARNQLLGMASKARC